MTTIDNTDHHFLKNYPSLFKTELDVPVLEIPIGWIPLFSELCEEFNELEDAEQIKFMQVKEQKSELRIYLTAHTEMTDKIINKYKVVAAQTCMRCASEDAIYRHTKPTVLCDECAS